MKFVIFFGVVALACFCNAFEVRHPVFEGMLWKTENIVGALKKVVKDLEGKQQIVDEWMSKIKNHKIESFKKIQENLDKLEKSFKNTQCPTNFKDLKDEGKELKSKLYKCVNKEVSNLKEIRSSMVIDAKGLKAIQALEEGIEKCKSEVHSFSSAVNGFWCLTPIKREALALTPSFSLQSVRSLTQTNSLENYERAASKCPSANNSEEFAKKLSKELEVCGSSVSS